MNRHHGADTWRSRPMEERNGVVLERNGRGLMVLSQGEFLRLRFDGSADVGDEITFTSEAVLADSGWGSRFGKLIGAHNTTWARSLEVAAVLLLAVGVGLNGWNRVDVRSHGQNQNQSIHRVGMASSNPNQGLGNNRAGKVITPDIPGGPANKVHDAVTYVTVDINPSIEMGVDDSGAIVSVKGLNGDGERVLKEASVLGLDLQQAVAAISQVAYKLGYLSDGQDNEILLAGAPIGASVDGELEKDLETAREAAVNSIRTKEPKLIVNVSAVAVSKGVRAKAAQYHLSMGKYVVMGGVRNAGVMVSADQVRKTSLRKVLKTVGLDMSDILKEYMKSEIGNGRGGRDQSTDPKAKFGKHAKGQERSVGIQGAPSDKGGNTVITLPTMKYSDIAPSGQDAVTNGMGKPIRIGSDTGDEVKGGIVIHFDVLSTKGLTTGEEDDTDKVRNGDGSETSKGSSDGEKPKP